MVRNGILTEDLTLMKPKENKIPEMEDNLINFEQAKKAKGIIKPDGSTTDGDWLARLKVGTVFLTRQKKNYGSFELTEFHLFDRTEKGAVNLLSNQNGRVRVWVDSQRFSNNWDLIEELGWYDIKGLTKEIVEDGSSD